MNPPVAWGPSPWTWSLFASLILALLALDLGLGGHRQRPLTVRGAALWSSAWVGLGLLFGLVVLAIYGPAPTLTYYTAYLLEKALSVDNVFVFAVIFRELAIPADHQRRVLTCGILGALGMRAVLIAGGLALLERFHWVIYPFGALLLLASARLLWSQERQRDVVVAACRVCDSWVARILPLTPLIRDGSFWIRHGGRWVATPLFVALVVVEVTDLAFALDSVPAVLAVTREPFLIYTSNVFAMLGLRSLYFLLAGVVERFHTVRYALAAILAFVGAKILLSSVIHVPNWMSLVVVIGAVTVAVAISAFMDNGRRSGSSVASGMSGAAP